MYVVNVKLTIQAIYSEDLKMKLYELKEGQRFHLKNVDGVFTFLKIDGMYANILNADGELIFYAAYAECTLVIEYD